VPAVLTVGFCIESTVLLLRVEIIAAMHSIRFSRRRGPQCCRMAALWMPYGKLSLIKTVLYSSVLILGPTLLCHGPIVKCGRPGFDFFSFGTEVKIDSRRSPVRTANSPENCNVRGTIWPERIFAHELPAGQLESPFPMVGNGGTRPATQHRGG